MSEDKKAEDKKKVTRKEDLFLIVLLLITSAMSFTIYSLLIQGTQTASTIQLLGAGGFGFLIGWYVYYINRYRKGDVQLSDLATLIGVLGGGAILTLFPASTDLFGAYGIGLCAGFFGYFIILVIFVRISENFNIDWFLDGRRKKPKEPWFIPEEIAPTVRAMKAPGEKERGKDINV